MSLLELKKEIQAKLATIDDASQLQAVLTLLRAPFHHDDVPFTKEELTMLNQRREAYLKGEEKAIPWEEVQARVKEKYGL